MGRAKKWKILAWINFFMIWVWGNAITRLQLDPAFIVPMVVGTAFTIMACLDLAWCIENVSKQIESSSDNSSNDQMPSSPNF